MKGRTTDGVSRRNYLRGSLGLALAAGCFTSLGIRAALREAQAAGKPLLTELAINGMIPIPQNQQAYLGAIDFAQRDLLGYLTANFHLTLQQIAEVRSIPREDLMQLNALLDRARTNSLRLNVEIRSSGGASLAAPNAVYLRVGPRVRSRSVPQEGEPQPMEKGDPGQVQERALREKQEGPPISEKWVKVSAVSPKDSPVGVQIPYP